MYPGDTVMSIRHTDEFASRLDPPAEEPEPLTRFIDIHVYEGPAEPREIPIVESQQDNQEPARPRRYQRRTIPLLTLASLALIGTTLVALLYPSLNGPAATE